MEDLVGHPIQKERAHSLNRSCEACRGRKIRCVQQAANGLSRRCARCEKMVINCVYIAPSARQRKKRVDGRVTELEKEVREMRKKFEGDDNGNISENGTGERGIIGERRNENNWSASIGAFAPISAGVENMPSNHHPQSPLQSLATPVYPKQETISVEGVSESTATQLFNKFKIDLAHHYPLLHIAAKTTARDFNQEKPTLFLAILAATAISVDPILARALNSQIEKEYTDKIFVNGEKSLELIQSLLISVVWYNPPAMFKNLKFIQYVHMAANMALDIHIGMREGIQESESKGCQAIASSLSPRTSLLKAEEHLLGATFCALAVCIQDVEKSEIQSDIHLSSWAKLQHLAEQSVMALGLDDHQSRADFSNFHTQSTLRNLDAQINEWKETIDWYNIDPSLKIHFHFVRAKLHEVVLYLEYTPEEFTPPYLLRIRPLLPPNKIELSREYIECLGVCIRSTHALLDVILSMSTEKTRCLPVIVYTRMFYAVIVLIKLDLCVHNPDSSIGTVLDAESLKVLFYLSTVKKLLQAAAGKENFSVPSCFLAIHERVAAWYQGKDSQALDSVNDLLEPMTHLTTTDHSDKRYKPKRMAQSEHYLQAGNTQDFIQSNSDGPSSDLDITYDRLDLSLGFSSDTFEAFPFELTPPRGLQSSTSTLAEFSYYGLTEEYGFQHSIPWGQNFPETPKLEDYGFYPSNSD